MLTEKDRELSFVKRIASKIGIWFGDYDDEGRLVRGCLRAIMDNKFDLNVETVARKQNQNPNSGRRDGD